LQTLERLAPHPIASRAMTGIGVWILWRSSLKLVMELVDATTQWRNTFDPNENSDINIGQVFFINQLDSLATPIPEEHLFDEDEDMGEQVFNDIDLQWGELNIIKD
jgi:hypothetical protein